MLVEGLAFCMKAFQFGPPDIGGLGWKFGATVMPGMAGAPLPACICCKYCKCCCNCCDMSGLADGPLTIGMVLGNILKSLWVYQLAIKVRSRNMLVKRNR